MPTVANPVRIRRREADQLSRLEPQGDLGGRVLRAVAAVDQVVLHAQREVAADRARGGLRPVGRRPSGCGRRRPPRGPPDHRHRRPAGQELQAATRRTACPCGRRSASRPARDRPGRASAPASRRPFCSNRWMMVADQPPLDGVGLQEDEGLLHGGGPVRVRAVCVFVSSSELLASSSSAAANRAKAGEAVPVVPRVRTWSDPTAPPVDVSAGRGIADERAIRPLRQEESACARRCSCIRTVDGLVAGRAGSAQTYTLTESPREGECFRLTAETTLTGTLKVTRDGKPVADQDRGEERARVRRTRAGGREGTAAEGGPALRDRGRRRRPWTASASSGPRGRPPADRRPAHRRIAPVLSPPRATRLAQNSKSFRSTSRPCT